MATQENTSADRIFTLAQVDEICTRLNQAIGIVDLLGNADAAGMDDDSMNNASWAAKSLLKEVMKLVDTAVEPEAEGVAA